MTSFRAGIIIPMLLLGVLAIAMFSTASYLTIINHSTQDITSEPSVAEYVGNISSTLEEAANTANESETALGQKQTFSYGQIIFDSMGTMWTQLKGAPVVLFNLTFGLIKDKILGQDTFYLVLGTIGTILTITIIFLVYKWVRTGWD